MLYDKALYFEFVIPKIKSFTDLLVAKARLAAKTIVAKPNVYSINVYVVQ